MNPILASPFVPGYAIGVLQRRKRSTTTDILLLHFEALEHLSEPPAGLIIIGGAPLAHTMIQLYGLGIPTVIVTDEQAAQLREGSRISLDGYHGWICENEAENYATGPAARIATPGQPVYTADGKSLELRAGVASLQGVKHALNNGATSIGMVRSEFLVPEGDALPDEAYYLSALEPICQQAHPLPVTIRTLDLAPDKHPGWLGEIPGMSGPLGLRGSRLYAHDPVKTIFRAELRAIRHLTSAYDVRLLLPYLTIPDELPPLIEDVRHYIEHPIPLGVMIETPAAALTLPLWLEQVDFVVIGCNDLMQCLFAADRDIPEVASLLDPYSPILYRFLHQLAETCHSEQHRIQLGGLLPLVPGVLPLLIGMGYRNFSVEPLLTPCIALVCSKIDSTMARGLARKVCAASSTAEVRELLDLPVDTLWAGAKHNAP